MQLILPKTLVAAADIDGPLIFLAGPIKGGGEWQESACHLIWERRPKTTIAVPRRWEPTHSLSRYSQGGDSTIFSRQTPWERHYLELASRRGCVLFWLPSESRLNPRGDGQPYARDTYGELGEWRGRLVADPSLRVIVGAEPDFPGLDVIQRNFDCALRKPFTIHPTLEQTVEATINRCPS
jgi:hypothetical protein